MYAFLRLSYVISFGNFSIRGSNTSGDNIKIMHGFMITYKASGIQLQICSQEKDGNSLRQMIYKKIITTISPFNHTRPGASQVALLPPSSLALGSVPSGQTHVGHFSILIPLPICLVYH